MPKISVSLTDGKLPGFLGSIGYDGDTVYVLEITGADAAMDYKMDMKNAYTNQKNVLDLTNTGGVLTVAFDETVSIPHGRYRVQLRTVEPVMHSNIADLIVLESINAVNAFPQSIPSEIAQAEARILAAQNAAETAAEEAAQSAEDAASGKAGTATTGLCINVVDGVPQITYEEA